MATIYKTLDQEKILKSRLSGKTSFGLWTVLRFAEIKNSYDYWECKCVCGNIRLIQGRSLLGNKSSSCGCIHPKNWILGQKFNRLLVIGFDHKEPKYTYWLCFCDCGNTTIVRGSHLVNNDTKSCGCLAIEIFKQRSITHGMSNTRFYIIHRNMINRCLDSKDPAHSRYGGRGITVCPRWLESFENFRDDMYQSYLKHHGENNGDTSLDRIDVNGNYEPSNVRWATDLEQNNNRRSTPKTLDKQQHNKYKAQIFTALHNVIRKKYPRTTLTEKYIGLSTSELFHYIESLWITNMTWDNYGLGANKWNIDHIIGCNNFDLSIEEDRYRCWNYTNLRPMWWKDNMAKSKSRDIF